MSSPIPDILNQQPTAVTGPVAPPQASFTDVIAPVVAPLVQAGLAQFEQRVTALEAQAASAAAAALPAIGGELIQAGTAIALDVEHDQWLQRTVVLALVGAAIAGALIILVSALLGNGMAEHWIAAAPGLLLGAVLWVSHAGVNLPARK